MNQIVRALLLDGALSDRKMLGKALRNSSIGIQVTETDCLKSFELKLAENVFDVVLVDIDLLDGEAFQAIDSVRRTEPDLPIVVTGPDSAESAVESLKRGVADYIVKAPAQLHHLPATISDVLDLGPSKPSGTTAVAEFEEPVDVLAWAQEAWEQTFDVVPDMVALLDRDHRIVRMNKAMADRLSVKPGQCVGATCHRLMHGTHRPPSKCPHPQVLKDGRVHEAEFYESRIDGDLRVTVSPLRDADGRTVGFVHVARDMSPLRQAERALRESEEWFRSLIEKSASVYGILDARGTMVYVSPSVEWWYGWKPEDLIGQDAFRHVHPDDLARIKQLFIEGIADPGTLRTEEFRYRHKNGSWRDVTVSAVNRREEGSVVPGVAISSSSHVLALMLDITDRKETEHALAESRQRFQVAVECVSDLFYELDLRTDELKWFGDIDAALGCAPGAFPKTLTAWLEAVHHNDAHCLALKIEHHRKSRELFRTEYRIRRKDGTYRTWVDRGATLLDSTDKPSKLIGVCTDITERQRAANQLRQREAEMAHLGRLHTVGELAATLAHEINQPLCAINNYVRGVKRRLAKKQHDMDCDELGDVMELVTVEIDRAVAILGRMRDFVRRREPHRSSVDICELLQGALCLVEAEARSRETTIVLQPDENLPLVQADRIQIEQVVVNLIQNALDAIVKTPPAQRTLTIAAKLSDKETIEVAVADTGFGLPEDMGDTADEIFTPFFSTKAEGLGLGLAISRSIIEAHGGRIWAQPNTLRGMTLHFTLPLV